MSQKKITAINILRITEILLMMMLVTADIMTIQEMISSAEIPAAPEE